MPTPVFRLETTNTPDKVTPERSRLPAGIPMFHQRLLGS